MEPIVLTTDAVVNASRPLLIVLRSGSVLLRAQQSESMDVGDVVIIAPDTPIRVRSTGLIRATGTAVSLDSAYLADQLYWQYYPRFRTREHAQRFISALLPPAARRVIIGRKRTEMIGPWLDELADATKYDAGSPQFFRAQALVSAVLNVVAESVPLGSAVGRDTNPRAGTLIVGTARGRQRIRGEAMDAAELMRNSPSNHWSLGALAAAVHLSPSHFGKVFRSGFGISPIAFLIQVRAERMALLLRTTDLPVSRVAREVGWDDPNYASRQFRRVHGVAPRSYRDSFLN